MQQGQHKRAADMKTRKQQQEEG
jgi:hypothetical protein